MVVDQLLADLLVHASEGEVGAGKVAGQLGQSALHQRLNSHPLLLGDAGGKTKSINGTANPNAARVNWNIAGNISLDFVRVHVRGVSGRGQDSVVFLNERVENNGEVLV